MNVSHFFKKIVFLCCVLWSFGTIYADVPEIDSVKVPPATYWAQAQSIGTTLEQKWTTFKKWYTANNKRVTLIQYLVTVNILDFLITCVVVLTVARLGIRWFL